MKPIGLNEVNAPQATQKSDPSRSKSDQSINSSTVSKGGDQVNLSKRAEDVVRLVAQVRDLPEIRHERVESLRQRIESGVYNPSSNEIADAILRDESQVPAGG